MGDPSADGLSLVRHFAMNYGMPYKYVVSVNSKAFSEAPPVIMNVLNRLTWAGKRIVNDGTYKEFNELLCLGYFEKQKIDYHDDGEVDLGPTIITLSIGGEAEMIIRMKAKFYFCCRDQTAETYDFLAKVKRGTYQYEERLKLAEMFKRAQKQGDRSAAVQAFEDVKAAFFAKLKKDGRKTAPAVLTMPVKHGDIVAMHGSDLQRRYEHTVIPKGKLRYGLTCRHIKPENIPMAERWKGDFAIKDEDIYDGGVRPPGLR